MEKKISSYNKLKLEIERLKDEKTSILQEIEKIVRHPTDFETKAIIFKYKFMFDNEDMYWAGSTSYSFK